MGFRFFLLNILFLGLFGLVGFNLYQLQVAQGDYYFSRAEARADYLKELELRRGNIFFTDKFGNQIPVALNKDYQIIFAAPNEIKDFQKTAHLLSSIVGKDALVLEQDLNNPKSRFKLLVDKASVEQVKAVISSNLEGVHIGTKQYRFYPFDNLASNILGFVGLNKDHNEPTGLYGVELLYNEELKSGKSIYLTIDRNLQAESEKILNDLVEQFGAVGGSVIIQDPKSGKILALANYPYFDPNNYGDYPVSSFINPAIQHVYEAGSVFKPITMAVGIQEGVITPETTYIDKGSVTLNGKTIKNWDKKAYGTVDMTTVIERSINTGAVFVALKIGREKFVDYLLKFGFGDYSGIDIPQEVSGSLDNLLSPHFRTIDLATAGFGQGTAVTPIQMINAFSALANGGILMRPYTNASSKPHVVRRVVSVDTAFQTVAMMESAVQKAFVASIPGYRIAGKTGTAQIPDFNKGGYSDDFIHTFIGFGPVSNPKFTILIKLDKPEAKLAGFTVVPAFRKLAQYVINYYGIPPDGLGN